MAVVREVAVEEAVTAALKATGMGTVGKAAEREEATAAGTIVGHSRCNLCRTSKM